MAHELVLESAPADVAAFTFLPAPTPLAIWARRQASEIAMSGNTDLMDLWRGNFRFRWT